MKSLLASMLGSSYEFEDKAFESLEGDAAEEAARRRHRAVNPPSASLDTPASIGLDVACFLAKLPPGMDKEKVSHMSLKNIDTAIRLSESMGVEERNDVLVKSVTATRMIPAAEDNRKDKLHPARHFPGSMADPEEYWKGFPLRVEPHVPGIPLAHVGLENLVSPLAIMKAGDRTNRLYIKYFLRSNLNVQQKAPKFQTHRGDGGVMGLTMEENWKDANRVSQIQDALWSYVEVMLQLYGATLYGPRNLLRLMNNLDWLRFRHDQLYALKQVVDAVLGTYHYLACNKKPPLKFKKLQDFVTTTLRSMGGASVPPDTMPARDNWNNEARQNDHMGGGQRGSRDSRGGGIGAEALAIHRLPQVLGMLVRRWTLLHSVSSTTQSLDAQDRPRAGLALCPPTTSYCSTFALSLMGEGNFAWQLIQSQNTNRSNVFYLGLDAVGGTGTCLNFQMNHKFSCF